MDLIKKLQNTNYFRPVCYGLLLGLVCQIYISPFGYSRYVVSLGTPALYIFLLLKPHLPVGPLMTVMTVAASLLRGFFGEFGRGLPFKEMSVPAFLYYGLLTLLLTIGFRLLKSRRKYQMMLCMIFCDFAANALQLAFLGHAESTALLDSAAVAVIRGIFVWLLYGMYEWEHLYLRKKEHQTHYAQLNSIVTDIYAESFYLHKSMEDLNGLMKKSHQLYEDLKDQPELSSRALDIARETHEIRKDYQRIEQGIQSLVREHEEKSMKLSEVFRIIKDNTIRQIKERGEATEFHTSCLTDLEVRKYYDLFTILNNLIINGLDACGGTGSLKVLAKEENGTLFLTVTDTGCGIEEDMIPFIWGAGFSTKYDIHSGKMSTGIGLCHVENMVKHLHGTIDVKSKPQKGTSFYIQIPEASLF